MHLAYVDARIENYRSEFLSELREQFERVSIITDFQGEEIEKSASYPLYEKSLSVFSRKVVYFSSAYSSLSKVKPDLILTGDLGLRTLLCLVYAKRYSIPIYAWARLTTWSERKTQLPRKLLRKAILSRISGVFVNGKDGSNYINSVYPCKTHILYQSSAHSRLVENRTIAHDKGVVRWTFVGRLVEEKGLKNFIVALAGTDLKLRAKLHLDFVGVGNLRNWLEDYSQANNIEVKFHGNLNGNAIIELLDISDFFFFPSLGDEWGLAVVEAMNRGVPILGSSKAGVINELSSFGDFGIVFDPFSRDQMRRVIHEALLTGLEKMQFYSDESLRVAKDLELQPRKMAQKMYDTVALG
jgi:glycosyltransferase involved in cell wall biosynthesis